MQSDIGGHEDTTIPNAGMDKTTPATEDPSLHVALALSQPLPEAVSHRPLTTKQVYITERLVKEPHLVKQEAMAILHHWTRRKHELEQVNIQFRSTLPQERSGTLGKLVFFPLGRDPNEGWPYRHFIRFGPCPRFLSYWSFGYGRSGHSHTRGAKELTKNLEWVALRT